MGMTMLDAESMELGLYTQLLNTHNDRQPEDESEPVEPPSIEWMREQDELLRQKGYRVN